MSSNHNLISLTSASNLRLEHFRTQLELARNFYDDQEFCPVYQFEEVAEHRERIHKRTSPYPSPSHSPPSYYISPKQQRPQASHHHHSSSLPTTRAIPIIDPSNMTPVSVPSMQQQYSVKASSTSPSMTKQWSAYNSNSNFTSPKSSNSSICSMSSSISSSSSSSNSSSVNSSPTTSHHIHQNSITNFNNHTSYYYGNNNCSTPTTIHYNNQYHYQQPPQQPQMMPIVARAIPIIDPATRQVYRQQQTPNIPPGFYNVSVC